MATKFAWTVQFFKPSLAAQRIFPWTLTNPQSPPCQWLQHTLLILIHRNLEPYGSRLKPNHSSRPSHLGHQTAERAGWSPAATTNSQATTNSTPTPTPTVSASGSGTTAAIENGIGAGMAAAAGC